MTWPFLIVLLAWTVCLIGTFVPVIPATLILFLGVLGATFLRGPTCWPDLPFLLAFGVMALLISLSDNLASAWGARKFGGSRQAAWGALVGGLAGVLIPLGVPLGLLLGQLIGALLAELIFARRTLRDALRSAWGTLLGVLASVVARFVFHVLLGLCGLWYFWDPSRSSL